MPSKDQRTGWAWRGLLVCGLILLGALLRSSAWTIFFWSIAAILVMNMLFFPARKRLVEPLPGLDSSRGESEVMISGTRPVQAIRILIGSLNSVRLAYLFRCLPEFRWKANSLTSYSLVIHPNNFPVELLLKQWGVALLFLPRQ